MSFFHNSFVSTHPCTMGDNTKQFETAEGKKVLKYTLRKTWSWDSVLLVYLTCAADFNF